MSSTYVITAETLKCPRRSNNMLRIMWQRKEGATSRQNSKTFEKEVTEIGNTTRHNLKVSKLCGQKLLLSTRLPQRQSRGITDPQTDSITDAEQEDNFWIILGKGVSSLRSALALQLDPDCGTEFERATSSYEQPRSEPESSWTGQFLPFQGVQY